MDRSAGRAGRVRLSAEGDMMRGTIACYPPVWGGDARQAALRTVVLTEAVATCLGASALLYGDRTGGSLRPLLPQTRTPFRRRGRHRPGLAPVRAPVPRPVHRGRRHQLVRGR